MIRSIFIILPFLLSMTFPVAISTEVQDESNKYFQYSTKRFFKLKVLKKSIDIYDIDYDLLNAAIYHTTNKERLNRRMEPLFFDKSLNESAKEYAQELVEKDYLSHISLEGGTIKDRVKSANGLYNAYGENLVLTHIFDLEKTDINKSYPLLIGEKCFYLDQNGKEIKNYNYKDMAKHIVQLWLNSDTHRDVIFDKRFTHMGCGAYFETQYIGTEVFPMLRVAQHFGGGYRGLISTN